MPTVYLNDPLRIGEPVKIIESYSPMSDAALELRRKAAMCRRLASIPTNGGSRADRRLITLAELLEHQARQIEEAWLVETVERSSVTGARKRWRGRER